MGNASRTFEVLGVLRTLGVLTQRSCPIGVEDSGKEVQHEGN